MSLSNVRNNLIGEVKVSYPSFLLSYPSFLLSFSLFGVVGLCLCRNFMQPHMIVSLSAS
jgi:hypothetical protein